MVDRCVQIRWWSSEGRSLLDGEMQMKDLSGQRFGRLVAIRPTEQRKRGFVVWECKCDCGNTAYVVGSKLTYGNTRSCGCLRKEDAAKRSSKNIMDLTGQRFGRLIAVRPTEERKRGFIIWECQCDCGNIAYVIGSSLTHGKRKSCGCLRKENTAK